MRHVSGIINVVNAAVAYFSNGGGGVSMLLRLSGANIMAGGVSLAASHGG